MGNELKYKYINKFVFYYSEQAYKLQSNGFITEERSDLAKVMIIARQHYIERSISLPITSIRDVRAAIQFEVDALKEEFYLLYKIMTTEEGITTVMLWQVPRDIVPVGVLLVLPETYLLANAIENSQLCLYQFLSDAGFTKLLNTPERILSSPNSHQSREFFCQSAGVSYQDEVTIRAEDFPGFLLKAIAASIRGLGRGFWISSTAKKRDWAKTCRPFITPVIIFGVSYLALTSGYISYRLSSVSSAIEVQKEDIEQVLNLQTSVRELQDQIELYQSLGPNQEPPLGMWNVLAPLFKQGVQFKFIRFNGEQVFFSAIAESASGILEQLLNVETIRTPQFSTAVRKSGEKEAFIIRFTLVAAETLDEE